MVDQYITTRPILDLWLEKERLPGERVAKGWWEQMVPRLAGAQGGNVVEELEEVDE